MNESARNTLPHKLMEAYAAEARRLLALAESSTLGGDYAHPVFGEGAVPAFSMLIGEAPGKEEAASGHPFVGKAGKQLNALLCNAGIQRETLFVTNAVKYRPVVRGPRSTRNRTPANREVGEALPLLEREIALVGPKLLVTLGNTPLKAVLQLFGMPEQTVGMLHGTLLSLEKNGEPILLFPLYHPASGIYNPANIPVMEADVKKLAVTVNML